MVDTYLVNGDEMHMARFSVPGEVVGKGRPKFSRVGGGVRTYTPEKTANFENLVKFFYVQECKDFMFEDKALYMVVDCFMAIPSSAPKKKQEAMKRLEILPIKRPDADNCLKSCSDALNGIAYKDDAQIVDVRVRKFYSAMPHTDVFISDTPINVDALDVERGMAEEVPFYF